ncbi:MAG: DNA-3-methyladenine glycosylase 2 family protein [Betaproteobacteria bacterium]|nr:DNA-3-methyladenine glycosylase 2 family protein [Betaproteobacteria bacterium]MSQ88723.1 DNA-3-methyladenine glycosylase 2 family protein [Betaproteobacteria bacterium]
MRPEYWDRAKRALGRRDPVMAAIMRRHPRVYLAPRGDPFHTLARAIVGQQISVKAAQSVWNKFAELVVEVIPEKILQLKVVQLRACGLSERKVEYIRDLAQRFADGALLAQRWPQMSNEDVVADLVQVRGIGPWTAEMFLMFNLLRPDVFPLDDLGLRKGIQLAYFKRPVSLQTMRKLGETWRPWRTVATWYLWRSLDPVPVEY